MLTASEVQKINREKRPEKTVKVYDERGLYLEVPSSGSLRWRLKYRFEGREKLLSLGVYPDTSLASAREKRDEARQTLARRIDPSAKRQAEKASASGTASFEAIAREWIRTRKATEDGSDGILGRLENWIFPYVGKFAPDEIDSQRLLAALRRPEDQGKHETAHRARLNCGQVFRFAISTGRATKDPTVALKGALKPVETEHFPSVTEQSAVGALLRAMDSYRGSTIIRVAFHLMPLVFVRPFNLRKAEWSEFDLDGAKWLIPKAKLKLKEHDLIVPLAKQAVALLREVEPLTAKGRWLFPQPRSKEQPISDATLGAALAQVGYSRDVIVPHGFRATARTMLDEELHFPPDWVEHQLNHRVVDANGRAYNRTRYLPQRTQMMQRWADYLDELKSGTTTSGTLP